MLPPDFQKRSAAEESRLGLPAGYKLFTSFPFAGMVQSDSRVGMKDDEAFYIENLIKLGNGNYRALPDQASALYTAAAGKTIIYFYPFNIGATNYHAVFLNDGTAYQINTSTGASTTISSTANTFYNSSLSTQIPVCGQWGAEFLIIANNFSANNYWVWDGGILYTAGTLGPLPVITNVGSGYTSAPTVTAYGGSGSGATFSATVSTGNVVQLQITNAGTGYEPGDIVQLRFSGGGSNDEAQLTAVLAAGTVTGVVVTNVGSGYPAGTYNLGFSGGGGSSAAGTYTVGAGGTVTSTAMSNNGSNYTSSPAVTFPVGIKSVTITNAGSGYTPGTYNLGFSGGGGSSAAGTYTVDGTGTVVSTAITVNGSGYTSAPTVSFPSGGGSNAAGTAVLYGTGASGIATLSAGSIASVTVTHGGSGFTGTPTLTVVGGGGTGASLTAVLTASAISSVTVNNGGTNYTSTPAIEVQTGLNNAAHATITLMPFGVSGSSVETFQSRVWLGYPYQTGSYQVAGFHNGDIILVSSPNSISDFATSDGGVSYANTDSFLKHQYTNIKQSNGYLYPMGDSSISVISNVQTSGNPPSTTFNYQNTDPQIGTSWRDSVVDFSRTILLGNPLGAFGLYGGAVTKISGKIDQLFTNLILPSAGGVTPSSAVANIYSKRVFVMNATITDPFTLQTATKLLCWDEKDWFIASQASVYTYITTQEVNSTLYAWGTDGNSIYQLFSAPTTAITKKISSKLYGAASSVIQKQAYSFILQAQDLTSAKTGMSFNVNIDTNYLNPNTNAYSYTLPSGAISMTGSTPTYPVAVIPSGDIYGMDVGYTLTSTSADFALNFLGLGYMEESAQLALSEG